MTDKLEAGMTDDGVVAVAIDLRHHCRCAVVIIFVATAVISVVVMAIGIDSYVIDVVFINIVVVVFVINFSVIVGIVVAQW